MNINGVLPHPLIETVAGFTAGAVTTVVVHPLDLIKTRLQVNQKSRSRLDGSIHVARNIFLNEGGALAFYRGLGSNLIGNSTSWALYFLWYEKVKNSLSTLYGVGHVLSYYDFFLASGVAGVLTAICTNPIWVIKTRMLSTSSTHEGAYSSIFDGIRQIYRSEGIVGFYRGLVPSLLGVSHGALQFMTYEQMKKYQCARRASQQGDLTNFDYLVFSGFSKLFAGSVTYPYQVVRSRLQTYDAKKTYKSARDVASQLWRREGLLGFYKGLGPNLLRVVPSSCVTFLVYENVKTSLPRIFGNAS